MRAGATRVSASRRLSGAGTTCYKDPITGETSCSVDAIEPMPNVPSESVGPILKSSVSDAFRRSHAVEYADIGAPAASGSPPQAKAPVYASMLQSDDPSAVPSGGGQGFFASLWQSLWTPSGSSSAADYANLFDTSKYYLATVPAVREAAAATARAAQETMAAQAALTAETRSAYQAMFDRARAAASSLTRPLPTAPLDASLFTLQAAPSASSSASARASFPFGLVLTVGAALAGVAYLRKRRGRGKRPDARPQSRRALTAYGSPANALFPE